MARRLVLAAVLVLVLVTPALAQLDPDAAREAERVVMEQLAAFRRDDYDTAYTFASETIRARFDRASFERMVRTGYPEIARSEAASVFLIVPGPDGALFLRVKIRGANGQAIEALYELVREGGGFRINGVATRSDGPSAAGTVTSTVA